MLDQMRSPSCPQPVPRVQSSCSSWTVQSLAPTPSQMAAASSKVAPEVHLQPSEESSLSPQTAAQAPPRLDQPGIATSEQHRTSCGVECASHDPVSLPHRPDLPHSETWHGSSGGVVGGWVVGSGVVGGAVVGGAVVVESVPGVPPVFRGGVTCSEPGHLWQLAWQLAFM